MKPFFKDCEDGVHQFEARYDKSPADISMFKSLSGAGSVQMIEKLRKVTYVHDICVRCGKTILRNKQSESDDG